MRRQALFILDRKLSLLIGMNFLIGLLFAHYFFTTSFLKGQVSDFLWPEGDITQYLTGAKFFIYDDWQFPVFISNFLERSYPQSMAFSDTVPLFALFAKIIYKLAGYEIAHLAYWYFTAILLQPVAFSLLLWSMGVRDLVLNAAGGILSLLVPAFLFRVGHAPLFGHFTFITAMALYFVTAREAELRREMPHWLAILWLLTLLLISLVNMYLLAMSLLFCGISWTRVAMVAIRGRRWDTLRSLCLRGGGTVLILAAFMYATGWFVPFHGGDRIGYNSMNLMAPFVPQRSSLFGMDSIIDATGTGGQDEGYNYLGAGFLLLLLFAFVFAGGTHIRFLRSHSVFMFGLLLCTLFALSNIAYAGHYLLWSVPAPEFLGAFRSSGQFVWPVTYFLLAFGLYVLNGKLSSLRLQLITVLIACIGLQWLDTRALLGDVWDKGHDTSRPKSREDAATIRKLMALHAGVHIEPDFGCRPDSELSKDTIEDLAWLAALERKPINTMYLSRDPIDHTCDINTSRIATKLDAGYMAFTFYDSGAVPLSRDRSNCAEFVEYAVCVESRRVALSAEEVHQLFSRAQAKPP